MTVEEIGERMTAYERSRWIKRYNEDPFGPRREDLRHAIVACVIANCHIGKKQKAFKPEDFIPSWKKTHVMNEKEQEIYNRHIVLLNNYLMSNRRKAPTDG